MTQAMQSELIETARAMNAAGINRGTSGNLSIRSGGGMFITPSGLDYDQLSPADIVYVDDDGRAEGSRQPSSEWRIHFDLYRARPDAAAILHAHPTHCAALACLRRPLPAFHYMVAVAGGAEIPCAPYATFGSQELSDGVVTAIAGRKACLMANHGLICLGPKLPRVLALAIEIEHLAEIYLECLAVGEPALLDEDEMARVLKKFESYGRQDP